VRALLIRLSSFGDVVFTLPLARALGSSADRPTLAWAIEGPLASLVEGAPGVDRVLTADTRGWRRAPLRRGTAEAVRAFLREARAFRPDLVVDAQGLFKSALVTVLVPAPRKVGFGWRTATERINCLATRERVEAPRGAHTVDRALALAEYLTGRRGFPRTPDVSHLVERKDAEVDQWLDARGNVPFAVLQPFSSKAEKAWRKGDVVSLLPGLLERGFAPVVRWGPGERQAAEDLVASSNGLLSLAPKTTPASTARVAARAALFVGVDTGPTHLAAASGTPTLALFGPTPAGRFGPVGPRAAVLAATGYNETPSRAARWPAHEVLAALDRLLV